MRGWRCLPGACWGYRLSQSAQGGGKTSFCNKVTKLSKFNMPGFFGTTEGDKKASRRIWLRFGANRIGLDCYPASVRAHPTFWRIWPPKNSSKTPEKFGTGIPDAHCQRNLQQCRYWSRPWCPLITWEFPEDSVTACLLGGFDPRYQPGPMLFQNLMGTGLFHFVGPSGVQRS